MQTLKIIAVLFLPCGRIAQPVHGFRPCGGQRITLSRSVPDRSVEPATPAFGGQYSIQLSYGRMQSVEIITVLILPCGRIAQPVHGFRPCGGQRITLSRSVPDRSVEPATPAFGGQYSIQLSYGRMQTLEIIAVLFLPCGRIAQPVHGFRPCGASASRCPDRFRTDRSNLRPLPSEGSTLSS